MKFFSKRVFIIIVLVEGLSIFLGLAMMAAIQASNDYVKELNFMKVKQQKEDSSMFISTRNGKPSILKPSQIMVGDVIDFQPEIEIPADAVLLEGLSVQTEESSMTGETDPIKKQSLHECIMKRDHIKNSGKANISGIHAVPSPLLLSGTRIQEGSGRMLIVAVGERSALGKITRCIQDPVQDSTDLQLKMEIISTKIGYFSLGVCSILFLASLVKAGFEWSSNGVSLKIFLIIIKGLLMSFSLLVIGIPEEFPLIVSLTISSSIRGMLFDKLLIKKLEGCENMAHVDTVCTMMSGILTEGKMYSTHFWNKSVHSILNYDTRKVENFSGFVKYEKCGFFKQLVCLSVADHMKEGDLDYLDDKALVQYMKSCGVDVKFVKSTYQTIAKLEKSWKRKISSTIVKEDDKTDLMLVKGDTEKVLNSCEKLLNLSTGEIEDLDEESKKTILLEIEGFSSQGLGTCGFGFGYPTNYDPDSEQDSEGLIQAERAGLTFVGFFGFRDMVRQGVPEAVKKLKKAGINLQMATGSNTQLAKAVALECNIIRDEEEVANQEYTIMDGKKFYDLVDSYKAERDPITKKRVYQVKNLENFKKCYKHIKVLTRARPEDRFTMMVGLKERGHMVAATGDGTGDPPLLANSHVGFAPGMTGTVISKDAADVILIDDNFLGIVQSVKWGRSVYDCVRKILQFQLPVIFVTVFLFLITAVTISDYPLSTIQILWVSQTPKKTKKSF